MKLTAYFLGALRDGCFIRNDKSSIYRIQIYQKNKKWIEILSKIIERIFDKKPLIVLDRRDDVWSLILNSKEIYEKVIKISDYKGTQKNWNTPRMILESPLEIQKEYVKGFFDSEGGVPHVEMSKVKPKNIRVHITQSNKQCLDELKIIIHNMGIKTGKVCGPYYKNGYNSPIYRLKIHGIKKVTKFSNIIGSSHPEKQKRLMMISKTHTKA